MLAIDLLIIAAAVVAFEVTEYFERFEVEK